MKGAKKYYTQAESHFQNGIYLIIAVLVALMFWPLAPKPSTFANGVLLPQGSSYSAINPSDVTTTNMVPVGAQLVGLISTKIHYDSTTVQSDEIYLDKCLALAKVLAAEHGANIVVVNNIGHTIVDGPLDGFQVQANAYHGSN